MKKGFTLIELIIYLAIVSALATSLILWSLTVGDLGARARAGAALNTSGRFALQIITRDIELATTVISPPSAAPGPTLTVTNALGQSVEIGLSNGQLIRTVAGGNPLALTTLPAIVTDFTVTRTTGPWSARPSLSVSLTLRALPAPPRTFATVVNLRR
ncbi:MAG: prepilin-type N-terminal cleavage/methylation domain-containing protein [Candidatus Vogelbacteria bacterium]